MYNYSNCDADNYMMPATNQNNYQMPPQMINSNANLFNPYEGLIRGNMFVNLYEPYTANEPYPLTPASEREAMLNTVRQYGFALVDLNLYLDTHPEDGEKINTYLQYLAMEKQAKDEYERRYGPLTLSSEALNAYPWAWLTPPWPWEVN